MRALFVTVRMKPEYRDQILKGALEDGRGSREDEPGCLRFDVIQDDNDPDTVYFYEVYRDDAALEAHRAAPHYSAWGILPAEWFVGQKAVVVRGTMIAPEVGNFGIFQTLPGSPATHCATTMVTSMPQPIGISARCSSRSGLRSE